MLITLTILTALIATMFCLSVACTIKELNRQSKLAKTKLNRKTWF